VPRQGNDQLSWHFENPLSVDLFIGFRIAQPAERKNQSAYDIKQVRANFAFVRVINGATPNSNFNRNTSHLVILILY
jgi:hypothetical protein